MIFVTYFGVVAGLVVAGWIQETLGARVMFRVMAAIVTLGLLVLLQAECLYEEKEEQDETEKKENNEVTNEKCSLIKSPSAFADDSTERYLRSLKYDSLGKNKYVKDW